MTRFLPPLLILLTLLPACAPVQTEGRAAAILDASEPEARAHAGHLAEGDLTAARQSGVRLLAVLGLWYD